MVLQTSEPYFILLLRVTDCKETKRKEQNRTFAESIGLEDSIHKITFLNAIREVNTSFFENGLESSNWKSFQRLIFHQCSRKRKTNERLLLAHNEFSSSLQISQTMTENCTKGNDCQDRWEGRVTKQTTVVRKCRTKMKVYKVVWAQGTAISTKNKSRRIGKSLRETVAVTGEAWWTPTDCLRLCTHFHKRSAKLALLTKIFDEKNV